MAEERGKPFVAWVAATSAAATGIPISPSVRRTPTRLHWYEGECGAQTPVVVTPLLPNDPKPGETWLWQHAVDERGHEVTIAGAPLPGVRHDPCVPVVWRDGTYAFASLANLRRPPVLKTYRVHHDEGHRGWTSPAIRAESPEDALAKLVVREVER